MADKVAKQEILEIVDSEGFIIGTAPRSSCHGDPSLVHRAAHVLLFNRNNELLLQKRADDKQIQPGRWDSSVGGHLDVGESFLQAAVREMHEELGIEGVPLSFLYYSQIRNEIESENIATYLARHDGPFNFCRREISEVRFWSARNIESELGQGVFTPNFEDEWQMYKTWCRHNPESKDERVAFCAGDSFPNLFAGLKSD